MISPVLVGRHRSVASTSRQWTQRAAVRRNSCQPIRNIALPLA